MTPENYKIQVLLRTEGFFRQQKNSRVISKIDSTTGSFNRYETGLGPLISLLWTTPIIIRPQPNRGTKRTETGLYQNKKGTAPTAVHTGD